MQIHPSGDVLRKDVLPKLKLSQTELARRLGVSPLSVVELPLEKLAWPDDNVLRTGRRLNAKPES